MKARVDVQYVCEHGACPGAHDLRGWVEAALRECPRAAGLPEEVELTIRLVDTREGTELNRRYRGQPGPTNVLSFPCETPTTLPLLGDIVICAPVVAREVLEQNKDSRAHWAHMVVHGVLHLLGYDHQNDEEADHMESLEIKVLSGLGFRDPYAVETIP